MGMVALIAELRERINILDPENLISSGSPPDEYRAEAESYAGLVAACPSTTPPTQEQVAAIWREWFEVDAQGRPIGRPSAAANQVTMAALTTTIAEAHFAYHVRRARLRW